MVLLPLTLLTGVPASQPAHGWVRALRPASAPRRVVSLAPSVTETLFALGLGPRVVGVTRFCDRPPGVQNLPRVGGFSDPSLEAILALRPDAVVAVPSEGNRRVVERLVDLRVPVLVVPDTTVEDVRVAITLMGAELGAAPAAQTLWNTMEARMAAVGAGVKGRPPPRVLILYDTRPAIAAGPGSFADAMLTRAGAINVVKDATVPYPTLSLETVVALRPDVVLDASMGARTEGGGSAALEALLGPFSDVPAVRTKRLLSVPPGVLARPGPSMAEDLEVLADLCHGNATPKPNAP